MPEAWYEQEDKYNLCLFCSFSFLGIFFYNTYSLSFCSFWDGKVEHRPQMSALLLFVHSQSVCFGRALLWHRCCKKEKRNREVKLHTDQQSAFFGMSLFVTRFQERVFFGGKPDGIPQKVSNKYPRTKNFKFVSLEVLLLCWEKTSLVWLNQDSLQQDECVSTSQSVSQSKL